MTMMQPNINMNGTDRKDLVRYRLDTMDAIRKTMAKLIEFKPHGRDYIGSMNYTPDLAIWNERFATLDKMLNEIQEEALAIHNGDKEDG